MTSKHQINNNKSTLSPSLSQNSLPYYEVDIETYCLFKNGQVILTLRSTDPKDVRGEIVAGKPVMCNHEYVCRAKDNPKCFLHSIRIETNRNIKR